MRTLPHQFELREFEGLPPGEEIEAISDLRFLTWRAKTDRVVRPDQQWIETLDSTARHYLVYEEAVLVAAARLHIFSDWKQVGDAAWYDQLSFEPKPPVASLTPLVVQPKYQHQGIGKYLDVARIARAKELGAASVFGDVPPYRVKYFEKRGFKVVQTPNKEISLPDIERTAVYLEF